MAIPKIMNGPKAAQAPQNKVAVGSYSGGKGYNTKPITGQSAIADNPGNKDFGI